MLPISVRFGAVLCAVSAFACLPAAPNTGTGGRGPDGGSALDAPVGSGGSTTGAASGGATGSGGDGTPGGGSGGRSGGSGGAPAPTTDMIDNLDDSDGRILQANGRQGPWHSFNDQNGGNQQPPVNGAFTAKAGGANSTSHAVHTTGSGFGFAGVGFDLNNPTNMPEARESLAYNASAFTGIRFWAKGNGNLRIELPQKSFVPTDRGGSCSGTCWNVYGSRAVQGKMTETWQEFTIPFSSLQREDGSMSPAFNPAELMGVSFKHEGSSFDFWIDEVQFVGSSTPVGGSGGASGSGGRGGTSGGSGGRGGATGSGGATGTGGTVVHPPPVTNGANGWASRYWDCCKPACGWQANVRTGTPMVSCDKQNNRLNGNFDARNSCESGGTAYMCWDGAPWAVSDKLAYGFAAASGANYVCGRCYQLQFTGSGHNGSNPGAQSLNGKTMIVQIINNGGVAGDQFDLLIPGGGVGEFNGCSAQWGTSDLGAQYGGFLLACSGNKDCVQQRCQTVFGTRPDLMRGCEWFLGWFNAADNPNFVFKPIACPQEIKTDSGLSDPG